MTKDYKETNRKNTQDNSGYGWMLSGIVIGLLAGLGMYFYSNHTNTPPLPEAEASENIAAAEEAQPAGIENLDQNGIGLQEPDPISLVINSARIEQQDRKRATFSYYAVLPNLELDVNVKPSEADAVEEKTEPEELNLPAGSYLLQIASFKSEAQAVRSQSKLKNKGLETQIEKKDIKGKLWYRLFAGPTGETEELASWKSLVEQVGFKPLILKQTP